MTTYPPPPEYPHEATIYIQRKLDPAQAITVDLNMSLRDFKVTAERVLGVAVADQRIYQRGVMFSACCCGGCRGYKDDQSLGHYDIRNGDTVMIIPCLTQGSGKEYSFTTEIFARNLIPQQLPVMVDMNMLVLELKDLIVERFNSTFSYKLEALHMRLVYKTKDGPRELLNGQSFVSCFGLPANTLKVRGCAGVGFKK
ncbi:hypothetical protein BJY01DRAFT_243076 [Aspergillus pseudoustus]|uniref:Ubiquitin-like domain-containing protein n=1 Tax=Aspergillus pseudoustus TaxID=1810923 RepID=A0ABR4KUG4_9EURO